MLDNFTYLLFFLMGYFVKDILAFLLHTFTLRQHLMDTADIYDEMVDEIRNIDMKELAEQLTKKSDK